MASLKNKHNLKIEGDIEKYIKAEANKHQLRIKDFFEDYDKLRKGYITEDKVRLGKQLCFGKSNMAPLGCF
jgi:hypothetical protein